MSEGHRRPPRKNDPDWWHTAVVYQIYPRSFADGNGEGLGTLADFDVLVKTLHGTGPDGSDTWLPAGSHLLLSSDGDGPCDNTGDGLAPVSSTWWHVPDDERTT